MITRINQAKRTMYYKDVDIVLQNVSHDLLSFSYDSNSDKEI